MAVQPFAIEHLFQRLHAKYTDERVIVNRGGVIVPEQCAKAAWVTQAQHFVAEFDIHMVVRLRWGADRYDAQAARHPQMQNQRGGLITGQMVNVEQEVFGAAADARQPGASQRLGQVARQWVTQLGRSGDRARDHAPGQFR